MDRSNVENALVQVLENFQRCGITRFGSLPAGEVPAETLAAVSQLTTTTANPKPASASPNVARRSAAISELAATTPEATAVSATQATGATTGLRASDRLPSNGLGAEPWSLPVLSLEQRQTRFDELSGQVRNCRLCSAIVSYRQQTVFGAGPLNPRVCFMGEAPGADEDRTGLPFVGKAGQLLTKIITAMQLSRDEVYILNALKCRPPQNRTPMNEEIDHCRHFVESQLDTLRPEFIVCLGAVAVRCILRSELPIGRLRGQFYQYRGARVVVTYHPSYLLRNESAKKHVWEDMKMLMAELGS
ncbi:MAG: uracil-DNA glycosylase [Pirellulaceae bacterium]